MENSLFPLSSSGMVTGEVDDENPRRRRGRHKNQRKKERQISAKIHKSVSRLNVFVIIIADGNRECLRVILISLLLAVSMRLLVYITLTMQQCYVTPVKCKITKLADLAGILQPA